MEPTSDEGAEEERGRDVGGGERHRHWEAARRDLAGMQQACPGSERFFSMHVSMHACVECELARAHQQPGNVDALGLGL